MHRVPRHACFLVGAEWLLPVFGFASKRGAFDEDTAMRMRCPLLNTSDVLHRSTFNS
jgi:hypothetical protein